MEPDVQKEPVKKLLTKESIFGITIVLIVALIVGMYVLFSTSILEEQIGVDDAAGAAALSTQKGGGSTTGNIWDVLKTRGLQGEHYTLNIHGKKDDFAKQDCTVEPDPTTGEYSNNIFIPSNGDSTDNNQIIMTSGNAKGKWASSGGTTYGVRDSCTAPFDGDAAEMTIPPSEKGYFVVARVLGKPTENPEITLEGSLLFVNDELGNDLLVLGLVTDSGFQTPTQTLTRTKGKSIATDITGLFEWSGSVCYFDPTNYCYNDLSEYTCTDTQLCCIDYESDGIIDSCVDPVINLDGTLSCTIGSLMTLGCQDYLNEWVFNIGDLVGYLWDVDASGDFKLANIRFYPVK